MGPGGRALLASSGIKRLAATGVVLNIKTSPNQPIFDCLFTFFRERLPGQARRCYWLIGTTRSWRFLGMGAVQILCNCRELL